MLTRSDLVDHAVLAAAHQLTQQTLAAIGAAIVLEVVDRPPRYSAGDCVMLEGKPPFGHIGGRDASATGTVPCSQNGDFDKIARITRVEDDVEPDPSGYCQIPGDEDWFYDNGTETLYCIERWM